MVTSATASTAMSRIPTGDSSSPDTDWYVNAYCVYPVGDVSNGVYGVTYSYGTSPNSGSLKEYDVICMNPDGFAIYCNITLSYGIISPDSRWDGAWCGDIDGSISNGGGTHLSYGRLTR